MKKLILIFCLITVIGCKSKKGNHSRTHKNITRKEIRENKSEKKETLVKLNLIDVDRNQKTKAYELGKRILMTCNTSKFKPFNTSEATESVINNITIEKLSETCTKFRQWYGTFKDLKLMEVYMNNDDQTTVYRYKALYTKKVANKELQVYMNAENKVSAIRTLDWTDNFDYKHQ